MSDETPTAPPDPPTETPPETPKKRPETAPRRGPQKRLTKVDVPPPDFVRYLPYVAAVAFVLAMVMTIARSPEHALTAAAVLCVTIVVATGYVAWQHVISVAPDDPFRTTVKAVSVIVPFAILGPLLLTLFPMAPQGTATFERVGESATINVQGTAATLFLEARSAFVADVGVDARARYAIEVSRGTTEEEVLGTFQRTTAEAPVGRSGTGAVAASEATANRHELKTLRGPGRYTVTLGQFPSTLRPPMRVALRAEPFAPWMLGVYFGLLALVVLLVDAAIAKRGVESAFAAALLFPMVMVFYLHGHFTSSTIGDDLLAAGLVGLIGGGLGGEILARIVRSVVK